MQVGVRNYRYGEEAGDQESFLAEGEVLIEFCKNGQKEAGFLGRSLNIKGHK